MAKTKTEAACMATYQARLRLDGATASLLDSYGERFGAAERQLNRMLDAGMSIKDAKRAFIRGGLTARQFNSIRFSVTARRDALEECRKLEAVDKKRRIASIKKFLKENEYTPSEAHQKKRRLARLEAEIKRLETTKPSPVFGGRKLWNAQHHLAENGFASHDEWFSEWRKARSCMFFLVGCHSESFGNESCQYNGAARTLDVRLPDALGGRIRLKDVSFPHGQEDLEAAILASQPVSYRFVRKAKGWYVFASAARLKVEVKTSTSCGEVGVDIGPSLIAAVETDACGNPVWRKTIRLDLKGKTQAQASAIICDAAAEIVKYAKQVGKHIMVERLDFEAKKAELRERGKGYARMLSGFAYRKILSAIGSRAAKYGVGVIGVNPAFTSVIGVVKFAAMHGMSADEAAALAIGRRGMNLGEAVPSGSALRRPEDRRRHVWSQWNRLGKALRQVGRHAFVAAERGAGGGRRIYPSLPARAPTGRGSPGRARGKGLALRVGVPARTAGTTVGPASIGSCNGC